MLEKLKKTIIILFFAILTSSYSEPSGRGFDWSTYDIGLPSEYEFGYGLLIAILAIPLGYLFLHSSNNNRKNSFGNILGIIFIVSGIICLIPLIAWIYYVASILFIIGIAVFFIIAVLVLIINFFNNKKL